MAERVLNAEIDDHLDGEAAAGKRNSRNGYSKKTVLTETSKLDLRIPRDREGTFDPKLIARYQRRFPGFDEKIAFIAERMSVLRGRPPGLAGGINGARRSHSPSLRSLGRRSPAWRYVLRSASVHIPNHPQNCR